MPSKVLLEQSDENGNPTGKPAIKFNDFLYWFGHKPAENAKFRVLAIGTVVVCIQ